MSALSWFVMSTAAATGRFHFHIRQPEQPLERSLRDEHLLDIHLDWETQAVSCGSLSSLGVRCWREFFVIGVPGRKRRLPETMPKDAWRSQRTPGETPEARIDFP